MSVLSSVLGLFNRRHALRRTLENDAVFREIAEHSGDILLRVGSDACINYVSPSSLPILGWRPDEMLGHGPASFIFEDDVPIVKAAIAGGGRREGSTTQMRMKRKDGTLIWVEARNRRIRGKDGVRVGDTIVVVRDITERKAIEDKLAAMALTDGLTGIANRRAFDEALAREWSRTLRTGSKLSLLLMDIDHFKSFNDSLGHQVGDDCLRAVASAIAGFARRPNDLAARYGGEELALILADTDMAAAMEIADAARSSVEGLLIPHAGKAGYVTVSIGVATTVAQVGGSVTMPQGLLQAADTALYKAKSNGRNRVESALLMTPST
jgi:diguanylate cyclase (GGDEF)-like protein/PAS domain S-box-containing protein